MILITSQNYRSIHRTELMMVKPKADLCQEFNRSNGFPLLHIMDRRLAVILFFLGGACTSNDKYAPNRNFYFEVITHRTDAVSTKLADYVSNQIPLKNYTITNRSGMKWPFYKELNPFERILKDSLMPPHWFVHRMLPYKKDALIKLDEYLVRIDILPQPDTLPNYNVRIFKKDSTGLTLSGQSGIHYIDSSEFSSPSSLLEVYLKSIIRYSFK